MTTQTSRQPQQFNPAELRAKANSGERLTVPEFASVIRDSRQSNFGGASDDRVVSDYLKMFPRESRLVFDINAEGKTQAKDWLQRTHADKNIGEMSSGDALRLHDRTRREQQSKIEKYQDKERQLFAGGHGRIERGLGQAITLGSWMPKKSERLERVYDNALDYNTELRKDAGRAALHSGINAALLVGTGGIGNLKFGAAKAGTKLAAKKTLPSFLKNTAIRSGGLGGASFVDDKFIDGKSTGEAALNALGTATFSAGIGAGSYGATKFIPIAAKKALASTGKFLTEGKIDSQMYDNAIRKGFNLSDGTKISSNNTRAVFAALNEKARAGVQAKENMQIAKMNAAAQKLNSDTYIPVKDRTQIASNLKTELNRRVKAGEINPRQEELFNADLQRVRRGVTDFELYEIKQGFQNSGQKKLGRIINDYLRPKYSDYAAASDLSSESLGFGKNLIKGAKNPLQTENVLRGLGKVGNDKQAAMRRILEGGLPENQRFVDDTLTHARHEAFSRIGSGRIPSTPFGAMRFVGGSPRMHRGTISFLRSMSPAGNFYRRNIPLIAGAGQIVPTSYISRNVFSRRK